MRSGTLTKKITVKRYDAGVPDGTGGTTGQQLITVLETRCSYKQISSAFLLQLYQLQGKDGSQISFRKRSGFVPQYTDELFINDIKYAIQQILSDDETYHNMIILKSK